MNKALLSSKRHDWTTPQDFFDELNKTYKFTLDPAASAENHKCDMYFTEQENGLLQDWGGQSVFCNPPYGRQIGEWVKKAHVESQKWNTTVVMLIPARTDTKYFHEYIYGKHEIKFLKGRLKFGDSKNAAPFPSMLVVMKNKECAKNDK